ncbi:MAG TPA: TIM barrel protein [Anaerolineales bacterium]|nr:TIM barrel protein [Anaerolineales bacterium]
MNSRAKIKRSVSLYSFQEEYFHRKLTLEQIIATCAELGIKGIEILGDQMIRGYPNIPDEFVKQWHTWMEKYEVEPACLDNFLDWNKFKGRVMTEDEQVESMTLDILNAKKLGIPVIRVIHDVKPIIMERLAPAAEKHQVKLALEVHAPSDLDSPFEQELYEVFRRVQSPYVGFGVDFSLYTKRLPRIISERYQREGMKPEIIDYLVNSFNTHTLHKSHELSEPNVDLPKMIMSMGGREIDIMWAFMGTHMIYANPRKMLDFMPYILHIHGKFWEMLPDYTEYSIPYEEVIPVLLEGGYQGYLSSEYEGNRWLHDALPVDSKEQVRRHQVMLKQLLGES